MPLSMAQPAELLLIRDQYESAFHALNRGLAAEEAGKTDEALECYRKGRQHLAHGVDVPIGGEGRNGVVWDTARQLQWKMRNALRTVNAHLCDLATSQLTPSDQKQQKLLIDLPPDLHRELASNGLPSHSSPQHTSPTLPPRTHDTIPIPNTLPPRPASPAAPRGVTHPAEAAGTTGMANPGDQPPAYTPKPADGHCSLAYGPAGRCSAQQTAGPGENELLFIPSGVQMFFVAPNGQVTSLSHPGYLRIVTFENGNKDPTAAGRPSAFLHVCGWLYPLTHDTPVLLANSGIYMFPDSLAETPGSYVGIVLSSELPPACQELFRDILTQLAELRIQGPGGAEAEVINLSAKVPLDPTVKQGLTEATGEKEKPPLPGWSERMGQGILSGAAKLSEGLVKGAEATGRAIHRGGAKIRERVTPEETPAEVKPGVTKGLQATQKATGGAVRFSQFLVDGLGTVIGHVAEKVAPQVKKHGTKLIPESMKKSKEGEASNLDGAKFVAASSVQGFSTVWSSLEAGAKLVGKSVAAETVTTVTYKYGDPTGQATATALKSVVNVGVTAYNFDNLGIKAILKTAGKKTAKAMVKSPEEQSAESEGKEEEEEKKKEDEKKK